MMLFDILIYLNAQTTNQCDVLIVSNLKANEFLWFVTRSVQNYLWVLPVIYVFWPRIMIRRRRRLKEGSRQSDSHNSLFEHHLQTSVGRNGNYVRGSSKKSGYESNDSDDDSSEEDYYFGKEADGGFPEGGESLANQPSNVKQERNYLNAVVGLLNTSNTST